MTNFKKVDGVGIQTHWQDAPLTLRVVGRILNNYLSSLYRVVVSKYTERPYRCEWELTEVTKVLEADLDDRLGKIWVSDIASEDPDKYRGFIGVNYGYETLGVTLVNRQEVLLRDIFIQGKQYVDKYFSFDNNVSKVRPWDVIDSHQQSLILRHWHPDGGNKTSVEIVDILFGGGAKNHKGRSRYINNQVSLMRTRYSEDIVPYKNKLYRHKNKQVMHIK